jgi:hypothetical protein
MSSKINITGIASKINYGPSKKCTNTTNASKINNVFSLQRVKDHLVRVWRAVGRALFAPSVYAEHPFRSSSDNPSRDKAGRAAPFHQALDAKRGPRGVPTSLRDAPCRPGDPPPPPGAGRKSSLIGAGLAGLHTQPR